MESEAAARVAKSSAYLLIGYLGSNVIALAAFTIITRAISKHEMGLATYVLLISSLSRVLCDVGLSTSIIRFISEARGRGQDYTPFMKASLAGKLVFATAYSLALVAIAGFLLPPELWPFSPLFLITVLTVITGNLFAILSSMLIGLEVMKGVCAASLVSTAIGQGAAALLVLHGWGVVGYVMGWLLGNTSGVLLTGAFLLPALGQSRPPSHVGEHVGLLKTLGGLLAFSWPIFIRDLATYLFNRFDILTVMALGTTEEVGVYSVALKAYVVITMIPLNIGLALFPYYGEHYGREELEAIRSSTLLVSRFMALFFTPVAMGLAAVAEPVILVFAGRKYLDSAPVLALISFFAALTALTPMLGYLLITHERTKAFMAANLAAISCSLALAPIFSAWLGPLLGIALMKGLALTFLLAFYLALTRELADIDGRAMLKGLAGSVLMAVVVFYVQVWLGRAIFLPIYVLLGALIYAAWLRVVRGLSHEDVLMISHVFPLKLRGLVVWVGRLVAPPPASSSNRGGRASS